MINPFQETDWNPNLATRRGFGQSLVFGFPVLATIFLFSIWHQTGRWAAWPLWLGGAGAAAGVLFWLVPQIAGPAYLLWYFIACCTGAVVSNFMVVVVFYFVVTPVGLLLRLFGKDPMRRRFDPSARTYWLDAEKTTDPQRYFRPF